MCSIIMSKPHPQIIIALNCYSNRIARLYVAQVPLGIEFRFSSNTIAISLAIKWLHRTLLVAAAPLKNNLRYCICSCVFVIAFTLVVAIRQISFVASGPPTCLMHFVKYNGGHNICDYILLCAYTPYQCQPKFVVRPIEQSNSSASPTGSFSRSASQRPQVMLHRYRFLNNACVCVRCWYPPCCRQCVRRVHPLVHLSYVLQPPNA